MVNETAHGSRASAQVVLGLLVVGVGILFLLDNLGILHLRHALSFWPLAFIGAGAMTLSADGPRSGRAMGVILLAIGLLMFAGRLAHIGIDVRVFWPLVMIAVGALILYRTVGPGRVPRVAREGETSENVVDIVAILGGFERRVSSQDFRGGEITAIMGGCALDLREADMMKEAVINVFAVWGGITIKVPPDWTVVLQGTPIMGGFAEKTVARADNGKRLVVTGYAIMGGIEVRN